MKSYAASHLDEMLDQFEKAATEWGAKVYRATTAEDAKRYVSELVKNKGVKRIVKSKSNDNQEVS